MMAENAIKPGVALVSPHLIPAALGPEVPPADGGSRDEGPNKRTFAIYNSSVYSTQ